MRVCCVSGFAQNKNDIDYLIQSKDQEIRVLKAERDTLKRDLDKNSGEQEEIRKLLVCVWVAFLVPESLLCAFVWRRILFVVRIRNSSV